MANWYAESIRMTTFHSELIDVKKVDWWSETFGYDPEVSEVKSTAMSRSESGEIGGGRLFLIVTGNKVDWQFASPIDLSGVESSIGSVQEAYGSISEFWKKWLRSRTDIVRMAFGGVAYASVGGREEGYRELQGFLPNLRLDPENSRDLSYRINRPRLLKIGEDDVPVNRVMSWAVRRLAIDMHMSGQLPGHPGTAHTESFRATCEVDINTDAERASVFDAEATPNIIDQLKALGVEVVENGDIP